MKIISTCSYFLVLLSIFYSGGCGNPKLPDDAKVQINVPDEPHPGTRTHLITLDVTEGRDVFEQLYQTTNRIGMCSRRGVEKKYNAFEVMSVSYWGQAMDNHCTFTILKNTDGKWIQTGYGGVEVYDIQEGYPKLKYSSQSLKQVRDWYEKYVPAENRKR